MVAPNNGCDGFLDKVIDVILVTATACEEGSNPGLPT
jgi:hypothetical protein